MLVIDTHPVDCQRLRETKIFETERTLTDNEIVRANEEIATDRKFVVALARGLEVLRAFRVRDGFLGNHEIAERTGLPRPTISRITYTLCKLGYLTQVPRLGKYQLAPAAIALGYAALANLGIRQIAHPLMDEAAERLAAPIALGVIDGNRALYIDISRGSSTYTVRLEIGAQVPLVRTAMGRALISVLPERERSIALDQLAQRYPSEWPELLAQIEQARLDHEAKGFVSTGATWRHDVNAVGAAFIAADGSGTYALNCGGPPHQFTAERMETVYGPAMRKLVTRIEQLLGGGSHDDRE